MDGRFLVAASLAGLSQAKSALGSAKGMDIRHRQCYTATFHDRSTQWWTEISSLKAQHDPRRKARRLVSPWTVVGCHVAGFIRRDLPGCQACYQGTRSALNTALGLMLLVRCANIHATVPHGLCCKLAPVLGYCQLTLQSMGEAWSGQNNGKPL